MALTGSSDHQRVILQNATLLFLLASFEAPLPSGPVLCSPPGLASSYESTTNGGDDPLWQLESQADLSVSTNAGFTYSGSSAYDSLLQCMSDEHSDKEHMSVPSALFRQGRSSG
jgi:hypothetical protein